MQGRGRGVLGVPRSTHPDDLVPYFEAVQGLFVCPDGNDSSVALLAQDLGLFGRIETSSKVAEEGREHQY